MRVLNLFAFVAFFMQLPIEFVWSILIAYGWAPDKWEGIAVVKVILLISMISFSFRHIFNLELSAKKYFIRVGVLLLLITMLSIWFVRSVPSEDNDGRSLFRFYFELIFLYFYLFFIGVCIPNIRSYVGCIRVNAFLYLLMVLTLLLIVDYSVFRIDLLGIVNSKYESMYLFWADSFALIALFVLAGSRNIWFSRLVIVSGLLALYFISSRTSLFVFFFSVFYFLYIKRMHVDIVSFVLIFALMLLMYFVENDVSSVLGSRMFGFFFGVGDSSLSSRAFMFADGFVSIVNHPIKGQFAGQVISFGSVGFYIHNILSYWRQYGLLVFLMLLWNLLPLLRLIARGAVCRDSGGSMRFGEQLVLLIRLLGVYTIVSLLVARAFNYPYIYLVMGLYVRYLGSRASSVLTNVIGGRANDRV